MPTRPRRPHVFALVPALLSASVSAQGIADETGLTALRARLGNVSVPTGASVSAGQVEAPAPGWAPDAAHPEFAGKSFTYQSPTPSISGHATAVGQYFYGNSTSIAPGVSDVHTWEAVNWLGAGFLNGTGPTPPDPAPFKVLNNSWIGNVGNSNLYLRKLDAAIESQGLLVCSGVNNGAGSLDVPLLSHSFNGIACGRSDGQHRSGGTLAGFDRPARMKPELVAPAGATSFSTPLVAGACALMTETARTTPLLAGNPNAERPEVIKAALMAGATHRMGWNNAASTSGPSRGATVTPLDALYGADQVNVDRSHWILTAGEQGGAAVASGAPLVAPQGWERATLASGSSRYWRFAVEAPKSWVSVLATWNRQLSVNYGAWSQPDLDLELWGVGPSGALVSLVGPGGTAAFAAGNVLSASAVDNVEHLYVVDLQPGEYVLELRRSADLLAPWSAAIAWEFACAVPQLIGSGKLTSAGQEARLEFRGIPSEAADDFHLRVRAALPNSNGVLFFGATQVAVPFHGGTRYVGNPVVRTPLATCDANGEIEFDVALDPSLVGTTRVYQFWFRDAQAPDGTGVGLTNAVRVTFCR